MNFSVEVTAHFAKQLKRLSKKFPSLKDEFKDLINSLKEKPEQGTSLGNNCFKIRLAIRSNGKGKSSRGFFYFQFMTNQNNRILMTEI
jgi:mRNA-degrading endonuclease RelE of RelBE toxin-antitoxin system